MDREIVQRFVDAAVVDQTLAQQLLAAHPDLRDACWLGEEPLLCFLVVENFEAGVRFCLQNEFDPNRRDGEMGSTALHYACRLNYPEMARLLLDYGADPNIESEVDDYPIHGCVQNGNAKLLNLLIAHGADPHTTTDLGETVFDNWPNEPNKQAALAEVLAKHNVKRPGDSL